MDRRPDLAPILQKRVRTSSHDAGPTRHPPIRQQPPGLRLEPRAGSGDRYRSTVLASSKPALTARPAAATPQSRPRSPAPSTTSDRGHRGSPSQLVVGSPPDVGVELMVTSRCDTTRERQEPTRWARSRTHKSLADAMSTFLGGRCLGGRDSTPLPCCALRATPRPDTTPRRPPALAGGPRLRPSERLRLVTLPTDPGFLLARAAAARDGGGVNPHTQNNAPIAVRGPRSRGDLRDRSGRSSVRRVVRRC